MYLIIESIMTLLPVLRLDLGWNMCTFKQEELRLQLQLQVWIQDGIHVPFNRRNQGSSFCLRFGSKMEYIYLSIGGITSQAPALGLDLGWNKCTLKQKVSQLWFQLQVWIYDGINVPCNRMNKDSGSSFRFGFRMEYIYLLISVIKTLVPALGLDQGWSKFAFPQEE